MTHGLHCGEGARLSGLTCPWWWLLCCLSVPGGRDPGRGLLQGPVAPFSPYPIATPASPIPPLSLTRAPLCPLQDTGKLCVGTYTSPHQHCAVYSGGTSSPFSLPPRGWARSAASSRSLSPFPSSLRGARSRGAPGKMAAAGDGGGEGGAAAPGSGPRGPSPFSEARGDARGPVPAALHPEEVAARLQRMRRELSNRRKILVKNLPQDSSCQVRGRAGGDASPGAPAQQLQNRAAP